MLRITLVIVFLNYVYSKEFVDVDIKQGTVRGYKSREGIFEFYGIPYATAPTGTNKFKAALPPPTWQKIFKANKRRIACPQTSFRLGRLPNMTFTEDCLITNLYVPDTNKRELPVVVYIHGGAYQYGFAESNIPNTIVKSKEVIAVTFNYRLGPHGFLCLGTEDAPGNAAMKDQVALLRWVQENIASFGGNPKSVTISGCSAGGSSVDLHLISKMSRGLFHRAIVESASCIATFSIQVDPIENAKYYAKSLNFSDVEDIRKLESFYTNASLALLNSGKVLERTDASVVFTPCIEKDIGQEMFLDSYPFTNGDYQPVPMLFGLTDMEGLTRIYFLQKWKDSMNENFSNFLPEDVAFKTEEERREVGEKVKNFYFGNQTVDFKTAVNFIDYYTDRLFMHSITKSLQNHVGAGNSQVFFYEYSFYDKSGPSTGFKMFRGASHCAQSIAVLDEVNEDGKSKEYRHMKAVMRELWFNFIITGNPVPKGSKLPSWPPVGKGGVPFMSINSELELKWHRSNQDRVEFWDEIYEKHFRKPIAPTS